jgi:hypothetical protein
MVGTDHADFHRQRCAFVPNLTDKVNRGKSGGVSLSAGGDLKSDNSPRVHLE